MSEAIDDIVRYLRIIQNMQDENGGKARREQQGFVYSCVEDFLLRHGREFEPSPFPKRYSRGGLSQCFHNSRVLVSRAKGNLRYVEGYAMTKEVCIPLHHAWCVDKQDHVVDPTWAREGQTPIGYFGVVFPIELVYKVQNKDNLSVLHDWVNGYPLLRSPWKSI